jgi:hypothetical protein
LLELAAVRMLYDFLVVRQITPSNPAHPVRGPKYVVKKGKTPVWSREDAKTLLDSIPKDSVSGLRDLDLPLLVVSASALLGFRSSRKFSTKTSAVTRCASTWKEDHSRIAKSLTADRGPHCKNGHEMMIKTANAIRAATITVKLNFRIRRS